MKKKINLIQKFEKKNIAPSSKHDLENHSSRKRRVVVPKIQTFSEKKDKLQGTQQNESNLSGYAEEHHDIGISESKSHNYQKKDHYVRQSLDSPRNVDHIIEERVKED